MRSANQRGVSLVDALVATVIAGLLVSVSVTGYVLGMRAYNRTAMARHVLSEIRSAQSLAVARRGVFGFHWGGDASVGLSDSQYRIIRDTTGACGFPATGAPEDGTDVIHGWVDLQDRYPSVTISALADSGGKALGGVMFDSIGASVNTCTAVAFPVTVTIVDDGGSTHEIQIDSAGGARLL